MNDQALENIICRIRNIEAILQEIHDLAEAHVSNKPTRGYFAIIAKLDKIQEILDEAQFLKLPGEDAIE